MIPNEIGILNNKVNICPNQPIQANLYQNEVFRNNQQGNIIHHQNQGINAIPYSNFLNNSIQYQKHPNNLISILQNLKEFNSLNQSIQPSSNNLQLPPSAQNVFFSQYQMNNNMINYQISPHAIQLQPQTIQQLLQLQQQSQFGALNSIQQKQGILTQNRSFVLNQQDKNFMIQAPQNNLYQNRIFPFIHPNGVNLKLGAVALPVINSANQSLIQSSVQPSQLNENNSIKSPQQKTIEANNLEQTQNVDQKDLDTYTQESESELSFWNYKQPDDWKDLLPIQQNHSNSQNQKQNQKNKQKQGGNDTQNSQSQTKQTKKGNNPQATNKSESIQPKDPYFGIEPIKIKLKDFPQNSDDESVFQWWDQIDEIYFPSKIDEPYFQFLNLNNEYKMNQTLDDTENTDMDENEITQRIPPLDLLLKSQIGADLSENSSNYYLMTKDRYNHQALPFKQPNYFTVLFCDGFNISSSNELNDSFSINNINQRLTTNSQTWGVLAIYKLKYYDKKRLLSNEDQDLFDQYACQLDVVTAKQDIIEEYYQKLDQQIQISNSIVSPYQSKSKKQSKNPLIQREKQNLSGYEPTICKKFIGNNQIIQMSQIQKQSNCQQDFAYDKNKISIKLKKKISLDKQAIYSALQQQQFLNYYMKRQEQANIILDSENDKKSETNIDDDSDNEDLNKYIKKNNIKDSPIENNILSLEYELSKLYAVNKLQQLKQNIINQSKREGRYLELKKLSMRISDNMKWLTIRKNLIIGFSDRIPFDTKTYFKQSSEEKTGINLSRSQIIIEKEFFEKMTKIEQESILKLKLETKASEDQDEQQNQIDILRKYFGNKQNGSVKSSSNLQIKQNNQQQIQNDAAVKDEDFSNLSKENLTTTDNQAVENNRIQIPLYYQNLINMALNKQEEESNQKQVQKGKIQSSSNNKKKKKQKLKKINKLLEIDCSICFHHANNENNTVVYCSQCNISFHKHCYGIDFIPEDKFLCSKCQHKSQQLQQQKKKNNQINTQRPQKDEQTKLYQCKICSETLLPVISFEDEDTYYHPTCLFIFNYAIYLDSRLQLRNEVSHESITADILKQQHISCNICKSKKGLKVRCCQNVQSQNLSYNQNKQQISNIMKEIVLEKDSQIICENKNLLTEELNEYSTLNQSFKIEQDDKMQDETELIISQSYKQDTENIVNLTQNQEIQNEIFESIKKENINTNEQSCCNYYVHPLCAFLNGMEIWLDNRDEDPQCEQIIVESDFQDLKHLGLNIFFKCYEHADKINRNYQEQIYYRRFQINYKDICIFSTFEEYKNSSQKQTAKGEEQMNENLKERKKEYQQNENSDIKQEDLQELKQENQSLQNSNDELNIKTQNEKTDDSSEANQNKDDSQDDESDYETHPKKRKYRRRQKRRRNQKQKPKSNKKDDDNNDDEDCRRKKEISESVSKSDQQEDKRKKQLNQNQKPSQRARKNEGRINKKRRRGRKSRKNIQTNLKNNTTSQSVKNRNDDEVKDSSLNKRISSNDNSLNKKVKQQTSSLSLLAQITSNGKETKLDKSLQEELEKEFQELLNQNDDSNSIKMFNPKDKMVHSNTKIGYNSQNSEESGTDSESFIEEEYNEDESVVEQCEDEFAIINKREMKYSQKKKNRKGNM